MVLNWRRSGSCSATARFAWLSTAHSRWPRHQKRTAERHGEASKARSCLSSAINLVFTTLRYGYLLGICPSPKRSGLVTNNGHTNAPTADFIRSMREVAPTLKAPTPRNWARGYNWLRLDRIKKLWASLRWRRAFSLRRSRFAAMRRTRGS